MESMRLENPAEREEITMTLQISQKKAGCADGNYHIKAQGCIAASLHWADGNGILPDWSPIACFPLEPNGVGIHSMAGGRAVPPEATHMLARAVSADFTATEEVLVPIPMPAQANTEVPEQRYLVMTDLHLSRKPWQVRKALAMAREGYDAVLITGDITNDGSQEQLELFWQCVETVIPHIPVFAVAGNHDYPTHPLPRIQHGIWDYPALQQKLLDRAEKLGISCRQHVSGAYVAMMGDTEIIGLNAVTHWRRFQFPDNAQLEWLMFHLLDSKTKRHIILCHAPLRMHNPYPPVHGECYLSRDSVLQRIIDVERREVIFLSGHTHYSMNCREGCVEMAERCHLYINAGSIRPTALKPDETLQPKCWTEGNVVQLELGQNRTVVTGISMKSGQYISRGYYAFDRTEKCKI